MNDETPSEVLDPINRTDMNLQMSLSSAAADHLHLLYIIVAVIIAAIAGVVVLRIVHKKIDYSVDKSGKFSRNYPDKRNIFFY